ncbi:MAG: SMI1/KNR4 family protein [Cyclobacteriaceae bacterium]|nr:SMI1/KNR4 family protein [Cyclobacteriaceae bacterium]
MKISDRIQLLKTKLEAQRKKDTKLEVFGAGDNPYYRMEGHHYKLNKPLTEKEIEATEKLIGVVLPEEYREFLKLAGDGGAGPAWGIFELKDAHPDKAFLKEYPDFCSMEFPYDNVYADAIMEDIKDDLSLRGPFDDPFGGFIKLANYGHDLSAILITSGEQYGKMWMLDENQSITPFYQNIKDREASVGFLDWYENWLDETLPDAPQPQF